MTVVALKLTTGEEIIGEVVPQNKMLTENGKKKREPGVAELRTSTIDLKNVLQIVLQPLANGQVGIEFMQWAVAARPNATFTVDALQHAVAVFDPSPEMLASYEQQFSSIIKASTLPGH